MAGIDTELVSAGVHACMHACIFQKRNLQPECDWNFAEMKSLRLTIAGWPSQPHVEGELRRIKVYREWQSFSIAEAKGLQSSLAKMYLFGFR